MTPRLEDFNLEEDENQLYVSVWQDHGETVLGLLCQGPCLPNIRKRYSDEPEAYRGDRVRQIAPRVWVATMRATGKPAFTMRLDLRSTQPSIDFDDRQLELRRVSFQDAGYHLDPRSGQHEAMLFANVTDSNEFIIKPAPMPGADTFLYLAPNNSAVQTVRARNWHYQLEATNNDEAGSYFAVLHGELLLPDGDATVDVDIVRSPESDVGLWLSRGHQPKVRFWQTNDANTSRFTACTSAAAGSQCQILFLAETETGSPCHSDPEGRIAIWIDLTGHWRTFTADDHGNLRDAQCKHAYDVEYVNDTKVVLKDASGTAVEFTMP
jgi:hypothetical protein